MEAKQRKKVKCLPVALAACLLAASERALATEDTALPQDVPEQNIISVELPVQDKNEGYPLDFILDPQGLLYETDAARYGGGTVEEGATLLFHNREGEYDFSNTSDWLAVTNRGTGSVRVTVSAQVSELGEISLLESPDFGSSEACSIYLAIMDSAGHLQPLSVEKAASMTYEMDSDTYSFGLTGACNSQADWEHTPVHPVVTLTWTVESMEMPQEAISEKGANEASRESDAAQKDIPENGDAGTEEDDSALQEEMPGDEGTETGEGDADALDDQSGSGDAGIGEDDAGGQEDASVSGSKGEEMGEDTAEEQGDTSGSGETDTKEDDSGSQEDAPENGSKETGEYGSGMQGDIPESGGTDIGQVGEAALKSTVESGAEETAEPEPDAEESVIESTGTDSAKESASDAAGTVVGEEGPNRKTEDKLSRHSRNSCREEMEAFAQCKKSFG